jgi:microcystin-dependent protein
LSQYDFGTIDAATKSGSGLATDLNGWRDALHSTHKGGAEPSYKVAGMQWIDDSISPWITKVYDGADWVTTGYIDPTNNLWTPANNIAVVTGSIIWVAYNTAPAGYLKANGAAVSRSTYATLFSAIGTTFGSGDGSTTFNLPNIRGRFIRAWDDGMGLDAGRVFGSGQADEFKTHTHSLEGRTDMTYATGSVTTGSGIGGPNIATLATGGSETRPVNIAFLACIKY